MKRAALLAAIVAAFVSLGASAGPDKSFEQDKRPYDGPRFDFRGTDQASIAKKSPATSEASAAARKAAAAPSADGFEYIGGEGGWQLTQHRYVLSNGKLAHSQDCDHAIRTAAALPSADQLEALRRRYPGG